MKVGDKVVCINDLIHSIYECDKIKKGDIYTVTHIVHNGALWLKEKQHDPDTTGWDETRFRKVEPASTKHEFTNEVTKELVREFEEVLEELEKEKA